MMVGLVLAAMIALAWVIGLSQRMHGLMDLAPSLNTSTIKALNLVSGLKERWSIAIQISIAHILIGFCKNQVACPLKDAGSKY